MTQIDLNKIMIQYDLDKKDLADQLFPNIKYKSMALKRVLDGEALLDEWQIKRLSNWLKVPINNLFSGKPWKMKLVKDIFILNQDEFKAEVHIKEGRTYVFHKDTLFSSVLIHSPTIELSWLLKEIESLITKYLKQ